MNMINNKVIIYITGFFLVLISSGCFTAYQAFNTGSKSPVYLHITDANAYSFYVNGEKVPVNIIPYRFDRVSESYNSVTYNVTSLPALSVKANRAYVALRIVNNATGEAKQYILKSGLMVGSKFIIYFQGVFTMGLGNIIDFSTNSVYAWPEVVVE
jgi:hypothetical protein